MTGSGNMRTTVFLALAVSFFASGCKQQASEKPIGSPGYDSPSAYEALDAVTNALYTDAIDRPYMRQALLIKKRRTVSRNAVVTDEELVLKGLAKRNWRDFKKMYSQMKAIHSIECEWKRFPFKKFSLETQLRIGTAPVAAYRCKFAQVFNRQYAIPSLQNPEATGYFFKNDDGDFIYAGRFKHPF